MNDLLFAVFYLPLITWNSPTFPWYFPDHEIKFQVFITKKVPLLSHNNFSFAILIVHSMSFKDVYEVQDEKYIHLFLQNPFGASRLTMRDYEIICLRYYNRFLIMAVNISAKPSNI